MSVLELLDKTDEPFWKTGVITQPDGEYEPKDIVIIDPSHSSTDPGDDPIESILKTYAKDTMQTPTYEEVVDLFTFKSLRYFSGSPSPVDAGEISLEDAIREVENEKLDFGITRNYSCIVQLVYISGDYSKRTGIFHYSLLRFDLLDYEFQKLPELLSENHYRQMIAENNTIPGYENALDKTKSRLITFFAKNDGVDPYDSRIYCCVCAHENQNISNPCTVVFNIALFSNKIIIDADGNIKTTRPICRQPLNKCENKTQKKLVEKFGRSHEYDCRRQYQHDGGELRLKQYFEKYPESKISPPFL